jgi:hypothetical protein
MGSSPSIHQKLEKEQLKIKKQIDRKFRLLDFYSKRLKQYRNAVTSETVIKQTEEDIRYYIGEILELSVCLSPEWEPIIATKLRRNFPSFFESRTSNKPESSSDSSRKDTSVVSSMTLNTTSMLDISTT